MKRTIDTYTGKEFRWNTVASYCGKWVPARITSRTFRFLHPDRVPVQLLTDLNSDPSGQLPEQYRHMSGDQN